MILVVVGTQKFQFNRLLEKVDELIKDGTIKEKVVAQTGYSTYQPQRYSAFDFLDEKQFSKYVQECDILITHGGLGSILNGIKAKKKVIVVSRLKKYDEHVDNHQCEIAGAFAELGYVCLCKELKYLGKYLKVIKKKSFRDFNMHYENTADYISAYLENELKL